MFPKSLLFLILVFAAGDPPGPTPFEKSGKTASATYAEAVDYYRQLDESFEEILMIEYGKTDIGKPLHLVLISRDQHFTPEAIRAADQRFLLINNGIHAGEPCGVDASMMLARDLMQEEDMKKLLDHTVIGIIPFYNIGGALNRGCCSRANQEGPEEHGFRGNARNYDLNRDFIKSDSRNARSFAEIFHTWLPDVFIDTHTTNGADYPATLTFIPTHPDKAGPAIADYMKNRMVPAIADHMEAEGIGMCPYVNNFTSTPDKGIAGFLDLPRYSSGYAGLFHAMSFITEAHMLKPFADRVEATYQFLYGTLKHIHQHHAAIGQAVEADRQADQTRTTFPVAWSLDRNAVDSLVFDGYEAIYKPSEITGKRRLFYDRNKPYRKTIPYLNHFKTTTEVAAPVAYIIPQAHEGVIDRLRLNGVALFSLTKDTTLQVEVDYISDLKTSPRSYEGHFYHQQVDTRREPATIQYYAGDQVVFLNQIRNRYIVHTLDPRSQDSFFRWNYFDGILMQKEYFSSYVFEDEAVRLLEQDPQLRADFEEKKSADSTFASRPRAQLDFIYKRSPYYEKTHNRYPVARWEGKRDLPIRRER